MQKNISITIGGIVFHIEELAYAKLSEYLGAVNARFASQMEGEEIVADIENRIAERFIASLEGRERIIREKEVEELILAMGDPEQFEASDESESSAPGIGKKLYRNPDDALIGGVASGLAAYFGIEPVIMRLLFLVTLFFGGAGILLYIIMLVIVPEAKTPTEKLRMRGKAVTLDSVDQVIRESVGSIKKHAPKSEAIREVARTFGEVVRRLARGLGHLIAGIAGLLLTILPFIAILAASVFLVLGFTRGYAPYIEFPMAQAAGAPLFLGGLLSGYLVLVIPLFFIFRFGAGLLRRRPFIKTRLVWPLLAIWFIAIIGFATTGFHIGVRYQNFLETDPAYQMSTRTYELKDFSKLDIGDGVRVVVEEGNDFSVVAEGSSKDADRLDLRVEDGTLVARRNARVNEVCIFCVARQLKLTVQAPKFTEVKLQDGSRLTSEMLNSPELSADLKNGSSLGLIFGTSTKAINISLEDGSRARLEGAAEHLELYLKNGSYVDASELAVETAHISASDGSQAEVSISKKLTGTLKNGSYVEYGGEPQIEVDIKDGSSLRQED
jgi:phage shock protein PspC (stress-responsive transcriptional regulator)